VTEFANNAYLITRINETYGDLEPMNHVQRRQFSKIMVDNVIAAYEKSMLGVMLKAPFDSNNAEDWNKQLELMRYMKAKFAFKDELNFKADKYLMDFMSLRQQNKTLVEENFF